MRLKLLSVGLVSLVSVFSGMVAAKTTLTMSLWMNSTEVKPTMALLDQYEKATGVRVKPMQADYGSYLDKVLTMTASGKTPDIIVVDRQWLPIFAEKKIIRPLDDALKADGISPKRDLSAWKSSYYNQKFYGFSIWSSPNLLFYYPAMFKEVGLVEPYEHITSGRWNWDTFVDIGAKLTRDTNGDGKKDVWGFYQTSWIPDWAGKILQNGGQIFNDDYSKVMVDQPKAVEALKFWHDLSLKYGVAPPFNKGGKTAMWCEWLSTYPAWSASMKQKPEMTLHPAGKAGFATIGGGCPVTISRTTKYYAEAYRFAKWWALHSEEWKIVGAPALRSTWSTEYQKYLSGFFAHPEVAQKALDNMDPEPAVHRRFREITDAMNLHIMKLGTDKVTPQQAAADLAKDLTRIISRK